MTPTYVLDACQHPRLQYVLRGSQRFTGKPIAFVDAGVPIDQAALKFDCKAVSTLIVRLAPDPLSKSEPETPNAEMSYRDVCPSKVQTAPNVGRFPEAQASPSAPRHACPPSARLKLLWVNRTGSFLDSSPG